MSLKCFYAYPDSPKSLTDTIEIAIKRINEKKVVKMESWKSTSISGKFIISEICRKIDNCKIFCCDLTYLNPNVMFELGYAIARNKKIWITMDTNIEMTKKNYDRFHLLTTIGYTKYNNAYDIDTAFHDEEPYNDLKNTIFKNSIESLIDRMEKPKLFYLKSKIDTQASVVLSSRIEESVLDTIIDDPAEISTQTLSWYVQNAHSSIAVIAHLMSDTHKDRIIINAKYAMVSGLALGFGKPLLMLSHDPYNTPIDFRDILRIHKTSEECTNLAHEWLIRLEIDYYKNKKQYETSKKAKAKNKLQELYIGDHMAEHESEELMEYFVETSLYSEALKAQQSIIVGRKGTGKTANLYKISSELQKDVRNHVCIVKPVSYELEGILHLLKQSMPISEKGFLVESFWKFLLYTELAKSIYDKSIMRPNYFDQTNSEKELYDFVYENSSVITSDFSVRLQNAIRDLCDLNEVNIYEEHRKKVSEILHSKIISKLRILLSNVLTKKNKVCILIDNIDKAWTKRSDLSNLCDLIFGLLSVSKRITDEFNKGDDKYKKKVNLSLIIFIRSDIFDYVMRSARERDKISYNKIIWNNNELLLRIIEERLLYSTEAKTSGNIWDRYFCKSVKDKSLKEYLTTSIIPRPRDIVYLCKASIAEAVNSGHSKVEEVDIVNAEKEYSKYVFDSIIVENGITIDEMESVLYEFAGSKEILTKIDLKTIITSAGIDIDKIDMVIEHLCELTFLGIEVSQNKFEYIYDDKDKRIIEVLARKQAINCEKRYCINKPFHAYLEILPFESEKLI